MASPRDITIQTASVDGQPMRVDRLLADELGVSRAQAKRLLERGQVMLDGKTLAPGDKGRMIAPGQELAVHAFVAPDHAMPIANDDEAVKELASGSGWVALDKPAGMDVHPLDPDERNTLLNVAVARWPEVIGVGEGGLRSGVVHRLDRTTSGVVLLATEQQTWQRLRDAFSKHTIDKRYLALVRGRAPRNQRLVRYLAVKQHKPARVAVVEANHRDARQCDLSFTRLNVWPGASLVEVNLGTGFLHQVRVMLADAGHAIVGDVVYGDPSSDLVTANRPMLHAASVALDEIHARAEMPPDFRQAMERLDST